MASYPASLTVPVRKAGAGQAWVLIFAMFLPIMAIVALAPALPTLMERFKDVAHAASVVPMLLTVPSLCIALCGGLAGYLTDRFGRRKLMLGAMLAYFLGGAGPFFSNTFQEVLVSRIVLGIAEAFVLTIGNALLADYFSTEDRNKWLMVQGIVGPFLATGLLLVSGALAAQGWQWPFLLYGLTVPILLLGFLYLFEPTQVAKHEQTEASVPFPARTVTLLCAVTIATSIVYFVQPIQFSLVLHEIGISDAALIGRISAVASITVPLGAWVFKRNAQRSIQYQMALLFLLMGIGLTGIGLSHDYKLSVTAALFQQTAAGMAVPILVAWALSLLPAEHRGRGMGFWAASFFIGQFLSPLAVGLVRVVAGGLLPAVTISGVVCLLAAIMSVLLGKRNQTV